MSRLLLLHHGFQIKLRICCDHFPISSGHQRMKITSKKTKVKTVFKTQLYPIISWIWEKKMKGKKQLWCIRIVLMPIRIGIRLSNFLFTAVPKYTDLSFSSKSQRCHNFQYFEQCGKMKFLKRSLLFSFTFGGKCIRIRQNKRKENTGTNNRLKRRRSKERKETKGRET